MSEFVIIPRLVVADGNAAADYYLACFGGVERERAFLPDGRMVQAEIVIGGQELFVTQADGETALGPDDLGGSPVLLTVRVADADATWAALLEGGASVVYPLADQFYGRREGRLRDPFGHLWIVSQPLDPTTPSAPDPRPED
ncbi:MAG: VOC family protein [Actinomycetota bacterium]